VTLVSFLIPTLNRGIYVVRAVDSCLEAAKQAGVAAEVIVLDSESDDGSWEALQKRFCGNDSVRLEQNQRGLGPTHSWLDAAEFVTGDVVTFVWSDDYVAPHFLSRLLPMLRDGATVAIGRGAIRDIDDGSPLNDSDVVTNLAGIEALEGYLGTHPLMVDPPVSPASALFSRSAFGHWKALVPTLCKATELRQQLMWRRAIGPDLLLYLDALRLAGDQHVTLSDSQVVQFSAHGDSITIGSPPWLLRAGYWLSRTSAVLDLDVLDILPKNIGARLCARIMLQGIALSRSIPSGQRGLEDVSRTAAMIREEVARVRTRLIHEHGALGLVRGFAGMGIREAGCRLVRATRS
jgi:glycosyltransferase involved in cell wall biosynthesis